MALGLLAQQAVHLVEDAAEVHAARIHLQPAGLEARDIEHVVDQREQLAAGLADRFDLRLLALRQLRLRIRLQQL